MFPIRCGMLAAMLAIVFSTARADAAAPEPTPLPPPNDAWTLAFTLNGESNKLARSAAYGGTLILRRETFPNLHDRRAPGTYVTLDASGALSGIRRDVDGRARTLLHTDGHFNALAVPIGGVLRDDTRYAILGFGLDARGGFIKEFGSAGLAQSTFSYGGGVCAVVTQRPFITDAQEKMLRENGLLPPPGQPWEPSIDGDRALLLVGAWHGGAVIAHTLAYGRVVRSWGPLVTLRLTSIGLGVDTRVTLRGWPPIARLPRSPYAEMEIRATYFLTPTQPRRAAYTIAPFIELLATAMTVNAIPVPERTSLVTTAAVGVRFMGAPVSIETAEGTP